ncbi:hypothetical protein BDV93DRAFT_485876 [Ceratobasidium sp. AG-I]|nr:hypothetical protein BDV93DRAFT_485876 [Ceratobasidium sp. AG-I]
MFEYLSFLRPPPERCVLHQPVTLVPQIANDLRTELCEDEYHIYFTWQNTSGNLDHSGLTKLTTWRPGGMYKPLSVALPAETRHGDFWRLCLAVLPTGQSPVLSINLLQPDFGHIPFPVTSLPISIVTNTAAAGKLSSGSAKGKKPRQAKPTQNKPQKATNTAVSAFAEHSALAPQTHAPKQERIERFYRLPHRGSEHGRLLCITEQTSFDLDKKIWDSGVAVSSWLAQLLTSPNVYDPASASSTSSLVTAFQKRLVQFQLRTLQIVELGAGTGLVSLVLAALLANVLQVQPEEPSARRARILATDLPSAIELIEWNRAANKHIFDIGQSSVESSEAEEERLIEVRGAALDWDKSIPVDVWDTDTVFGAALPFDIIIMADVTYNTASFPALLDTVTNLLRGPKPDSLAPSPMILLAYKCRDAAERTLWHDASVRGILFVQVDQIKGVREPAVEVWLGGWEKDVKSLWGAI